eukprot:GHVS01036058.1.p1 GENE.GHVS01036058.1~~GHVS01036058.1.p1  ORF type:complete len:135 (-),score=5.42 GHVS01036058.1:124-528(-)
MTILITPIALALLFRGLHIFKSDRFRSKWYLASGGILHLGTTLIALFASIYGKQGDDELSPILTAQAVTGWLTSVLVLANSCFTLKAFKGYLNYEQSLLEEDEPVSTGPSLAMPMETVENVSSSDASSHAIGVN